MAKKQSKPSKLSTPDPVKRTPKERIDDAIWDIVYERTEMVCNSFIYLIQDFKDTQVPKKHHREYRDLLKAMEKRKKMWMQR